MYNKQWSVGTGTKRVLQIHSAQRKVLASAFYTAAFILNVVEKPMVYNEINKKKKPKITENSYN